MNEEIKETINQAIKNILVKTSTPQVISKLHKKHHKKIHFIPKSYRVFGGILQSMNIQFGNFIEELMKLLILKETHYQIIEKYSGKKSNRFYLSENNDNRIDQYITECQTADEGFCNISFLQLQRNIINDISTNKHTFTHDIDLLFKNKINNKIYYLEIKYNDDHDTGKFVDINRKFIKTYAYLVNELQITTPDQLIPILFFFNNKKMKGNLYIPEKTNIRRWEKFFTEFLTNIKYQELDSYLTELSESAEVKQMFDELYQKVVKTTSTNNMSLK